MFVIVYIETLVKRLYRTVVKSSCRDAEMEVDLFGTFKQFINLKFERFPSALPGLCKLRTLLRYPTHHQ